MTTTATNVITIEAVRKGEVEIAQLRTMLPTPKDVAINRKYVEGDHWQGGDAWVGPGPKPSDPGYRDIFVLIEKSFVSRNVIDEILDRLMSAVMGKEPRWYWAPDRPMEPNEEPTQAEQTLISEINAAQTTWWDKRGIHSLLKSMIYKMCFGSRCAWRLYLPLASTTEGGTVTAPDLTEAMLKLYVDIPEPENAGVWEDPDTKDRVGIVIWKDDNRTERAEVTYLEADGRTTVRLYPDQPDGTTNDFSGALPIHEVRTEKPRVTEQLRALNRSLNMTLTLLQKGLIDNHFLERLLLNAMPPGYWTYEDEPDEQGRRVRKAYVLAPHVTGGRQTSYVQGVDYEDEQGRTQIKDPSVVFREPTDPSGTIKGADYWYSAMLDESRQSHVIINKDAGLSGKSREQARGDFIDSTQEPQTQAEYAGRALLLTAAQIAEAIADMRGRYTAKLKPIFKCRPNYGPLTQPERLQNITEAKDGYMADETAMSLNGIDDTEAELAVIEAQPRAQLALSKLQSEAVKGWTDAGFTMEVALERIGLDEQEIADIMKRNAASIETDTNLTPPNPPVPIGPDGKPLPVPSPNGAKPPKAPVPPAAKKTATKRPAAKRAKP